MRNYNMCNFRRFALDFGFAARLRLCVAPCRTQYAPST